MSTTEMPMPAGTKPSPSYVLKDELAQFCLPKADNDPSRKVAWTNTFCLCVLAVGLLGIQKPVGLLLKLQSEEPPVVVIEDTKPLQQEFVRREETQDEEPQEVQPDQPLLPTLVVIDTGNVSFPVAVDGPVVVASSPVAAAPPPRVITRQVAPPTAKPSNEPTRFMGFGKKGKDGFVPTPDISDLPKELQKNLPRGTVTMRMQFTVTTQGQMTNVQIEKGSPYPVFDQFILDWYKRKGTFVARDTDVSYYENVKINFPD
jgi:TonB family protein